MSKKIAKLAGFRQNITKVSLEEAVAHAREKLLLYNAYAPRGFVDRVYLNDFDALTNRMLSRFPPDEEEE